MKTLLILAHKRYNKLRSFITNVGLYHPNGNLLITEAIRGVNPEQFDRIIVCARENLLNLPNFGESLESEFYEIYGKDIELCAVRDKTSTFRNIKQSVKKLDITGQTVILTLDSIFELENTVFEGNGVLVTNITNQQKFNLQDKYFFNNNSISEKVSNYVVNGFYFEQVELFKEKFASSDTLEDVVKDIVFNKLETTTCHDISTLYLWRLYQEQHRTIFIDLDGILFRHKEKRFWNKWFFDEYPIKNNITTINDLYKRGTCYIIILTERTDDEKTALTLKEHGIKYHRLIGNLPNSAKLMIGCFDYHHHNPYIQAINLPKNTESLKWSVNYEK